MRVEELTLHMSPESPDEPDTALPRPQCETCTEYSGPYDAEVGTLRRVRLKAGVNEASSLLAVRSSNLLSQLNMDQAWWLAHDEAGLGGMVSVLYSVFGADEDLDESWQVTALQLAVTGDDPVLTDAEALAFTDGFVFVFGSSFIGPKGILDQRRSFVARFCEHDVTETGAATKKDESKKKNPKKNKTMLSAPTSVLNLGAHITRSINKAIEAQDLQLLKPHSRVAKQIKKSIKAGADLDSEMQPINIEGAAFIGDDLVLGLRWPVSSQGQPLVARITGARQILLSDTWSVEALADCPTTIYSVDVDGTPKRPAGIRGMTIDPAEPKETLHLIAGPTERDLIAGKVQAAAYQHLRLQFKSGSNSLIQTEQVQTFEGYRKVEAVAAFSPAAGGASNNAETGDARWMYALDDEDAIVLLIQN